MTSIAQNTYQYQQSYNHSFENTQKTPQYPSYIPAYQPITYHQPINYYTQVCTHDLYLYCFPTLCFFPLFVISTKKNVLIFGHISYVCILMYKKNIQYHPMSDKRFMAMLNTFALELEKDKRHHMLTTDGNLSERTCLRIPNGTCITNPSTNQSYILQSYLTDTLQGGMYCGLYWPHSNHKLFELFLDAPQLAIKLCNEKHVRLGTNIENHVVLENANDEWKMNNDIYSYASKLKPFQSWLPCMYCIHTCM